MIDTNGPKTPPIIKKQIDSEDITEKATKYGSVSINFFAAPYVKLITV